jgi:hypothetical protein
MPFLVEQTVQDTSHRAVVLGTANLLASRRYPTNGRGKAASSPSNNQPFHNGFLGYRSLRLSVYKPLLLPSHIQSILNWHRSFAYIEHFTI